MKNSDILWIDTIPKNWSICRFKYFHSGTNVGESIDKEFWSSDPNELVFYTAGAEPIHTNYQLFPTWKLTSNNDLLLSRNGTPYVYLPSEGASYTDHIIRAKIREGIDRRYLRYCLMQSILAENVDTVSITTWSASIWDEQWLPFPPFPEQQRIADFLDSKCADIDNVLEKTRASIEEYKKLKLSVITKTVTKGIRGKRKEKSSKYDWIGSIPNEWKIIRIKNACWLKGRIGWDGLTSSEYIEKGPFLITGTDFSNGVINWDSCVHISEERFNQDSDIHIFEGDLLITKDGTIGKVAIVKNCPEEVSLNSGVLLIRNTKDIKYYQDFLYFVLQSNIFWAWYELSQSGNSTIKHLYQEQFYNFAFPLPDIEEQKEIAEYLYSFCHEIDSLIASKEKFITELETYKKSLIYEYVTGKKEVPATI